MTGFFLCKNEKSPRGAGFSLSKDGWGYVIAVWRDDQWTTGGSLRDQFPKGDRKLLLFSFPLYGYGCRIAGFIFTNRSR